MARSPDGIHEVSRMSSKSLVVSLRFESVPLDGVLNEVLDDEDREGFCEDDGANGSLVPSLREKLHPMELALDSREPWSSLNVLLLAG